MRNEEAGFTLVELLVTVVLISVISIITLGFMDSVTSVSGKASRHVVTENEAQVVLREMTQEIRGANPISATYPTGATCRTGHTFPPTTPTTASPAPATTGYLNCLRFAVVRSTSTTSFCANIPEVGRVPAPFSIITYGLATDGTLRKSRTDYTVTSPGTCTGTGGTPRVLLRGLTNGASKPLFTYFDETGVRIPAADPVADAGSVRVTLMVPYDQSAPSLELTSVASFRNN